MAIHFIQVSFRAAQMVMTSSVTMPNMAGQELHMPPGGGKKGGKYRCLQSSKCGRNRTISTGFAMHGLP